MTTAAIRYKPGTEDRLAAVRGVVWDLDNTLYRVDALMENAFNSAVARAAVAAGVPMTLPQATDAARRSFEEHGYSGRVFVTEHGLDGEELHHKLHDYMDETIIKKSAETRALFAALPQRHVLVTHSARVWAQRVLAHLGILEWFAPDAILGLEDYNFRYKHECRSSFDTALQRLGMAPEETVIVEDTVKNLKIPHSMGMVTAYLHHGRPTNNLPDYVHVACAGAVDFLQDMKKRVGPTSI